MNEADAGQALNLLSGHHMRGEGMPTKPERGSEIARHRHRQRRSRVAVQPGFYELQREDPKARETLGKAAASNTAPRRC